MLRLLLLLLLLAGALAAPAQAPPPGGYPLRVVRRLERVQGPPGGLLPYRRGNRWGYADTAGRVVVQPLLLGNPFGLTDGLGRLGPMALPLLAKPKPLAEALTTSDPSYHLSRYELRRRHRWGGGLINARGETLLLREDDEALLQPDSSLRAGRPRFRAQKTPLVLQTTDRGSGNRLVYRPAERLEVEPRHVLLDVGDGRYWRRRTYDVRLFKRSADGDWAPVKFRLRTRVRTRIRGLALADSLGHRLTGHNYLNYGDFCDNRLRTGLAPPERRRGRRRLLLPAGLPLPEHGLLFLDRQGRELVLDSQIVAATDFTGGTAVVWTARAPRSKTEQVRRQGAIIDTLGRLILPFVDSLSRPDEQGLLRLMRADSAGLTRFITRHGQPAFSRLVFRQAGAFHHGRAWVEAPAGRQGLINARGQWITAHAYEELGTPYQRYVSGITDTTRTSYFPPRLPSADTAYMRCRRAGKYGWVARHSGLEVIPACYDSIVYDLTEGLACAYRQGQPYVVNVRGRELARGEFRGDRYGYPGRPLQLYRPADGTWSVIDTTGRSRLPWLPGTGYLTPDGRAVVRRYLAQLAVSPAAEVVDSLGRVLLPCAVGVNYSGTPPALLQLQRVLHEPHALLSARYETTLQPSQVYRQPAPGGGVWLLRAHDLQPLTPGAFMDLHVLDSGWHAGRRMADSVSVFIDPAGRQYPAPRGTRWYYEKEYDHAGAREPFAVGMEAVIHDGVSPGATDRNWMDYVTRNGRRLWEDEANK